MVEGSGWNGHHGLRWVSVGLFLSMTEGLSWSVEEQALARQFAHVLFVVLRLTHCHSMRVIRC